MNIEQLKAEVARVTAETAKRVNEEAEIARLKATLELEGSEALFQAKVKLAASAQQTAKLQQLVDGCAAIVSSVPVHNPKTRTNRVWAGNHKYNLGNQVDLMYQLATGILYACAEHKQLLLAHTGLNLELLDQMVTAFGTPTYYSRTHNVIVEAKPYNVDMINSTVSVMQSELGVVIDTSALTKEKLENEFTNAIVTAQNSYDLAKEAIAEADFAL